MSYPNWHFQIREESNAWWATFRDLCKTITTFSCGISTIPLPLGGKENWIMLANYSRRFNRTQMSCQHFNIIYLYRAFRINRNHNRLHKAIVVNKSNKYLLPWFCFHNFAAFSIRREKPGFCLPSSLNSIFRFSHRWIIINCYDFIVFSICKQFSIVCKR